jgi:hypothetical protein
VVKAESATKSAIALISGLGVNMPTLSLRDLSQDIYDGLKAMAAQNHRSMQVQARLLIEREVRLHQPGAMERARSWRERMRDRPMPQLLEDLRADRDR